MEIRKIELIADLRLLRLLQSHYLRILVHFLDYIIVLHCGSSADQLLEVLKLNPINKGHASVTLLESYLWTLNHCHSMFYRWRQLATALLQIIN